MDDINKIYEQKLKEFFDQKLRINEIEQELEKEYLSILKPNDKAINKYLYVGNDINLNAVQIDSTGDIDTSYIEQTYLKVLFKRLKKATKYYFIVSKDRDPDYNNIVNDNRIVFVLDTIVDYKTDARERAKKFYKLRNKISNLEKSYCGILNNDVKIIINEIYYNK